MSFKNDYIDYVRNVLGVKSIYANEIATDNKSENIETIQIPLLVYVQDYNLCSVGELDLLNKMLAAVQIQPAQMMIVDLADQRNFISQMTAYLTDEIKAEQLPRALQANEIHTYSPRVLLKKPALKKPAWDELQKILRFFQANKPQI